MAWFETKTHLTHKAALAMLAAAVAKAEELGQPQCIVIVDANGEVLAELRMTGAKFLSRKSALAKALTAASNGAPSADVPEAVRTRRRSRHRRFGDRIAGRTADPQGRRPAGRHRHRLGNG